MKTVAPNLVLTTELMEHSPKVPPSPLTYERLGLHACWAHTLQTNVFLLQNPRRCNVRPCLGGHCSNWERPKATNHIVMRYLMTDQGLG